MVSEAYPNVKIDSIKKIDDNFHEILINNQIYYATNDGKYLIVGSVIDLDTKESITENTKMRQRLSIIESIEEKNLVIYKPTKTDYVLTIFTDTSCPYCQKLHDELPDLLENNIEVRYVIFSRNGSDVDTGDTLTYDFYFGTSNPPTTKVRSNLSSTKITQTISDVGVYYWKIITKDNSGSNSDSGISKFTVSN